MQSLQLLIRDLCGLLVIQSTLLAATLLLTDADQGDLRVQIAWLVFLIPGWLLSAAWTGNRASLTTRYLHAVISSIAAHGCLIFLGYAIGAGFDLYFVAFAALVLVTGWMRARQLAGGRATPQRLAINARELCIWIAVMFLVVSIYRMPRSNDIAQFSLQQQDMAAARSLQTSSIGMSAMGIDEAMPRWRAHHWHLWGSLMADATGLPVIGVLYRWAPIPLALSVIVSLIQIVRRLLGRPAPLWAVALAVFGPVVLWYRAYNAFNYSFRLTNNFCLDKDLALFLLVPAVVYLATGFLRGSRRHVWPLLFLIPALVKFHPMTVVYLVALLPFVVIGYGQLRWRGERQIAIPDRTTVLVGLAALVLFVAVVAIGDAQTSHEHINRIIRMDFADSQLGRPLHYWVGHYAAVEDHGLALDSTAWTHGQLHLRATLFLTCGLLASAQLGCLIWGFYLLMNLSSRDLRRWCAATLSFALLWLAWLLSPLFLSQFPHYLAGYERIHWFAYLPALVAVARAVTIVGGAALSVAGSAIRALSPSRCEWIATVAVSLLLLYSSVSFLLMNSTVLQRVRVLSSLLDFELAAQSDRVDGYHAERFGKALHSTRPAYLKPDDRVLFLDASGNDQYWLIKQSNFWSEPYAEAFVLERRGDGFLRDRKYFYALLDRVSIEGVEPWLDEQNVDLIVDRRDGADEFIDSLGLRNVKRLEPGVWRRTDRSSPIAPRS